jgi:hypothetical protein
MKGGNNMNIKKTLIITLMICCLFTVGLTQSQTVEAASSGVWQDLGGGWRFRVDGPHNDKANANWHVHAENKKLGKDGSEAVNGKKSHNDHLNDVPNKVKKKIKNHPEYKKGQKKQKDLDKAVSKIKDKGLKIDWRHIGHVVIAIAIVVACTATFFFQGDDIAAWMNLLRTLGC